MPARAVSMAPGGRAPGALSALRRSWSSGGIAEILESGWTAHCAQSSKLVELQLQATVCQMAARDLEPRRRQLDAALEMPVRYLQPVNSRVPNLPRQWGL